MGYYVNLAVLAGFGFVLLLWGADKLLEESYKAHPSWKRGLGFIYVISGVVWVLMGLLGVS